MVKQMQIDLKKTAYDLTKSNDSINLSKPAPSIDLTKSTNNINLVKNSDQLELVKKNVVSNLQTLSKKPKTPGGLPDIDFTEATDTLTKIPIQPFELYWTDQTAEPDYPDGLPFSFLPIGLEPEIVLDSCHIGIGAQPVLGFIKLPQQQIVFKYAECDPNKPPPQPKPSPTPASIYLPPAPPGCFYNTYWAKTIEGPFRITIGFGPDPENDFVNYTTTYGSGNYSLPDPLSHVTEKLIDNIGTNYYYEGQGFAKYEPNAPLFFKTPDSIQPNDVRSLYYLKLNEANMAGGFEFYADNVVFQGNYNGVSHVEYFSQEGLSPWQIITGHLKATEILACNTQGGEITAIVPANSDYEYKNNVEFGNVYGYITSNLICNGVPYDYPKNNPPPPLPLPPPAKYPKKKKMDCCPQVLALLKYLTLRVSEIDERVKLLDEGIKSTNKCLGVEEFPASLPKTIINKDEGFLAEFIAGLDEQVEVKNLTQLVVWFFERFDEVVGQWEIPIEVKDSDPTTPGDQPIGFKIPNLAEGFAEMFGLLLQSSSNLELLVNMQTRTLIEVGQDKQQNFISYKLLQALVDYINFDYKEVGSELPMMFKPGEEELDKMLVETMTKVTVAEFDDKIDFQRHLLVLLEMAKMWKAQNFKKLDLGTGMKQQIIDRIKALGQQSEELSMEKKDAEGKDQFDRFCEDVETQFASTPGILDAAHPYGGNFEDRPRIKKLGQ